MVFYSCRASYCLTTTDNYNSGARGGGGGGGGGTLRMTGVYAECDDDVIIQCDIPQECYLT